MGVGDNVVMQFHCAGQITESLIEVLQVDGDSITLDTDEEIEKCKRFNVKTGKCLNDTTFGGARRTLKLPLTDKLCIENFLDDL